MDNLKTLAEQTLAQKKQRLQMLCEKIALMGQYQEGLDLYSVDRQFVDSLIQVFGTFKAAKSVMFNILGETAQEITDLEKKLKD
jgi:hypothetical protein